LVHSIAAAQPLIDLFPGDGTGSALMLLAATPLAVPQWLLQLEPPLDASHPQPLLHRYCLHIQALETADWDKNH